MEKSILIQGIQLTGGMGGPARTKGKSEAGYRQLSNHVKCEKNKHCMQELMHERCVTLSSGYKTPSF